MADSREWENKTGSAPGSETEKTKTTIITERSRIDEDEERKRRAESAEGVKSYPAEYASGLSGSDEPVHGATVRGGENVGETFGQPRSAQQGGMQYGERGAEASTQVREKAGRMAEEARERGKGFLDEQKNTAADSLQRVASILHETGGRLEDDQPTLSQIFHRGASTVDRFAGTLRERSPDRMLNEIQDFARRQPALMLGGMVAAGFFLSRLLKSSSTRPESEYAESRFSGVREKFEERFGAGEETGEGTRTYGEAGQDLPGAGITSEEERHATE